MGGTSYFNVEQIYLFFCFCFFSLGNSAEESKLKFQTSWKVLGVSKVTQPSVALNAEKRSVHSHTLPHTVNSEKTHTAETRQRWCLRETINNNK